MANYPSVPGNRMALDIDGSSAVKISSAGVITSFTAGELQQINNETADANVVIGGFPTNSFVLLFPQARDISGIFAQAAYFFGGFSSAQWSADTTTGLDGSWTSFTLTPQNGGSLSPNYRTAITPLSLSGVKAVKLNFTSQDGGYAALSTFHVYGVPTSTAYDHLELWDSSGTARVSGSYFDWTDVPRSSTGDITFRVKNMSSSLTANSITVAMSALSDPSPTFVSQHVLSSDGVTFGSTASVASLAPGALSAPVTLRRTLLSNAALGLVAVRVTATAASWT